MSGHKFLKTGDKQWATQPQAPCSDCPMRRDALPGWLGGSSPQEWRACLHSHSLVLCHVDQRYHCAGAAVYRANVLQRAEFTLPADHEHVFTHPDEFEHHHSPEGIREYFRQRRLKPKAEPK